MSAPTDKARAAATPPWMLSISEFDAIKTRPSWHKAFSDALLGLEADGPIDPNSWSVYGEHRTRGDVQLETFGAEAEAETYAAQLRKTYPHLERRRSRDSGSLGG